MFGPVGFCAHCLAASSMSFISRRRRSHPEHGMSVALFMDDQAIDRTGIGWVRDTHKNPAHISRVVEIIIRRIDFAVGHDDFGILVKWLALRAVWVLDRRAVSKPDRPCLIGVA